jgi:hypothetical protein
MLTIYEFFPNFEIKYQRKSFDLIYLLDLLDILKIRKRQKIIKNLF